MTKPSDDILSRYLASQCSDSELAEIKEWISESPENARELFELEHADDIARDTIACEKEDERRSRALSRLRQRIATDVAIRKSRRRKIWLWSAAAAAIVAVLITVALPLTRAQQLQMVKITAAASPIETTLPDGSKVWLNKYTTIEYPEEFAGNRSVTLHGEAYFEVQRDTLHPFTVDGEYLDVSVLGTKFTFRSTQGDAFSFVSLVEGSVKVNETNGDGCVVLKPGQKATYDPKGHLLTVNDSETPLDAVWHDNNIPFRNATIRQIASALEQLYGMKVHVNSNVSSNATYSGAAMKYDSIDTTLNILSNTLPIEYTIANGEVWISAKKG